MTIDECNSYSTTLPSLRKEKPWNKLDHHFRYYGQSYADQSEPGIGPHDREEREESNRGQPDAWGDRVTRQSHTEISNRNILKGQVDHQPDDEESDELQRLSELRRKTFHRYTAEGFKEALKAGKLKLKKLGNGRFMDKNGVILTLDGPFWPPEYGPLYGKPEHVYHGHPGKEPLSDAGKLFC